MTYALGLMSGTSMDGIDVAIIDPKTQVLVFADTLPYTKEAIESLKPVIAGEAFDMHYFAKLHQKIGQEFADVAKYALKKVSQEISSKIEVIGSHGQTICHQINDINRYTWQLGCPFEILKTCNIPVVYDFRTKNVCEGGQGAPLAPLYHRELFYKGEDCAVVNIGGIANISILKQSSTIGYDTGPGNCLLDAWVLKELHQSIDFDGNWAKTGTVNQLVLNDLLTDSYFLKEFPKSIGKEYFTLNWFYDYLGQKNLSSQDIQATFVELTAIAIANEVKKHLLKSQSVLICGGGAKNKVLMKSLENNLLDYKVMTTNDLGVDVNYLEAMMIAWLGYSRIQKKPFDLYKIMGGNNQSLLGIICE